jgi:hypothetical protein
MLYILLWVGRCKMESKGESRKRPLKLYALYSSQERINKQADVVANTYLTQQDLNLFKCSSGYHARFHRCPQRDNGYANPGTSYEGIVLSFALVHIIMPLVTTHIIPPQPLTPEHSARPSSSLNLN